MSKDPKISNIQIKGLIVSTVIGVGILSLPNTLVLAMGNDGWIAIVLTGILFIPILTAITYLFKVNPNKDFFEIGDETLGTVIFTICKLIFLIYIIIFLSYVSRRLGELVKAFLLPTTPIEVIIFAFILVTSFMSSLEIDNIVRAGYFIYPLIIIFAFLIILISIPKSDFSNILPVFDSDLKALPKGIKEAFFSFTGFEMILFALPYVDEKEKTLKTSIYSIGIITMIYVLTFIMTLTHFSIKQVERQTYPLLQLVKQINLPGYFLENLDGLIMALWVIVVFATMAPPYFAAGKILSKTFKTKSHKYFIWALIPIIYLISLYPENPIQVHKTMLKYYNIFAFISIVIIPALILTVNIVRKKVGR